MKPIDQQTILLTGATDGLGKVTALALARQGATVLLHGRSDEKLAATQRELHDAVPGATTETYRADFSSLAQVRQLAADVQARHSRLDMLINNAGIGGGNQHTGQREVSADGYELRFAVNYLAPFLLTLLLLPTLRASESARIINVTSIGQYPLDLDDLMMERHYAPADAYRQSKLAQVMFTFDLAEQLKDTPITVNCLHPASLMPTKMVYEMFGRTMSTLDDGLESLLYQAIAPELDHVTGRFFDRLTETRANEQAYNLDIRRQLWRRSEQMTGLPGSTNPPVA